MSIDLVRIYRELAGTPGSGVAVCAHYPYKSLPEDNSQRAQTGMIASVQGAWSTAFKQVEDIVFFAAKFPDKESAEKFTGQITKSYPAVSVLENF